MEGHILLMSPRKLWEADPKPRRAATPAVRSGIVNGRAIDIAATLIIQISHR